MFKKDILERAETELEKVIYMDTDSAFLNMHDFVHDIQNEDDKVKKIYDISIELEEYINQDVIKEFCKIHNIKFDDSKLSFKQEVIAKKALFLKAKKKYALDIIDKERTKLKEPKFDIKGIEIRRSDFPSYSKQLLQKLLNMILREDKNMKQILDFLSIERKIVREKIKNGLFEVARPVSYSKAKYESTIPGHIRGMWAWNDLISDYFRQGTKGYMFYIKDIDFDKASDTIIKNYEKHFKNNTDKKFTQIVVPDIEEKLPECFITNQEKMLELTFDKRCTYLCAPLGISNINWSNRESGILSW